MVFILMAALVLSAGYVMAQQDTTQSPTPGQTQPQMTPMTGQDMSQSMQQLQDIMQKLQAAMNKNKVTAADLRKMQDMFNQAQVLMNQMHMMQMMQMMHTMPMMKQMYQSPGSQSQMSGPQKSSEDTK